MLCPRHGFDGHHSSVERNAQLPLAFSRCSDELRHGMDEEYRTEPSANPCMNSRCCSSRDLTTVLGLTRRDVMQSITDGATVAKAVHLSCSNRGSALGTLKTTLQPVVCGRKHYSFGDVQKDEGYKIEAGIKCSLVGTCNELYPCRIIDAN